MAESMIDLEKISGLPIELKDDGYLKFNSPLSEFMLTTARKLTEMSSVLMNPNLKMDREDTYFVYRGIHLGADQDIIRSHHLTYDITIVPPLMLGKEFNKTLGHYHANIPGSDLAHPELYEVIHGHGLFFLQKMDMAFDQVQDIIAVKASAGDRVIYPPNYGHIFINIGDEPLVTANWVSTNYKPLYEPVAQKHGMAYYVVRTAMGYEFVPNPNYMNHPEIKLQQARKENEPMYGWGVGNPNQLDFLNNPQ